MSQCRLEALILLEAHRNSPPDTGSITQQFAGVRRLPLRLFFKQRMTRLCKLCKIKKKFYDNIFRQ